MSSQGHWRFKYAIVWSPIPILTWLLPCIGHAGICDSEGNIFDFAGPFTVNVNRFLFGQPARYLPLDPAHATAVVASASKAAASASASAPAAGQHSSSLGSGQLDESLLAHAWDLHLAACADLYSGRMYNLLTDNCHGLVVQVLRSTQHQGIGSWNMVHVAVLLFLRARFVSWAAVLHTWMPFLIIVPLGIYWARLAFLYAYLGFCSVIVCWFLAYTYCMWTPCPRCVPNTRQGAPMMQAVL